ncbi:MAG TPA: DUF4097 family beta strand repeat-containing protein [Bacteroidales bacterium]|nr:DUF4097 family beta strand repeat-containing protein [Bacteroidales bacterium]
MKRLIVIALALAELSLANAQKVTEKHINFEGKKNLRLNISIADSIQLETWKRSEVYILSSVLVNSGKDNDAYTITYKEEEGVLSIDAGFSEKYFKGRKCCCDSSSISWKIIMPENLNLELETIDGNITLSGKTTSARIKTVSGFVDLSLPMVSNADVDFSTVTGTVYSNWDLSTGNKNGTSLPVKVAKRINDGGHLFRVETVSGDIFFRKTE